MYCPQCGTENPENESICSHCKSKIGATSTGPNTAHLLSWLLVIGLLMVAFAYLQISGTADSLIQSLFIRVIATSTPTPTPTPTWVADSIDVATTVLLIDAGYYVTQPITVEEGWRNVRLQGRFVAQGGSGNDVEVWLTDEDGLINYSNGHTFQSWYTSGRTTVATLDVTLGPGKYYLIFSNTFSVFSEKVVRPDLQLHYEFIR